jgi:hypothetical protein
LFTPEDFGKYFLACIEADPSVPYPGAFYRRRGAFQLLADGFAAQAEASGSRPSMKSYE